jgi:hypothetical protein
MVTRRSDQPRSGNAINAAVGVIAEYCLTEAAIQLVPAMAALGRWGARHHPTTPSLRLRAELLADGRPDLRDDSMTELRAEHLGAPLPSRTGPATAERLAAAYAAALAPETGESPGNEDTARPT